MKLSRRMIRQGRALTVAMVLGIAFPLFAVGASQSESDSAGDISDEKLKAVARAYIEVYQINKSYESKIEAAQTTEEADQLQQAANQEMMDVIENEENVTVNEYNDVINALREDEELRDRLQAHVDEIQKEESNKD